MAMTYIVQARFSSRMKSACIQIWRQGLEMMTVWTRVEELFGEAWLEHWCFCRTLSRISVLYELRNSLSNNSALYLYLDIKSNKHSKKVSYLY